MKRTLVALSSLLLSSALFAQDINIKLGWQLLGAVDDINVSKFDSTCVDYLWKYNSIAPDGSNWQVHIANGVNYTHSYPQIVSLNMYEGYWIKGNSECTIVVDADMNTTVPTDSNETNTTVPTDSNETNTTMTITYNGLEYGIVESNTTGRVWLDRNLGATQVCTSSTDSACYGDYYEWGRLTDGHEKTTSTSTTIQSSDISNAGTEFIGDSSMGDWATVDRNGNLRTAQWSISDGTSVCPVGFRVPSVDELVAETTTITSNDDGINNFLKLPKSGTRYYNSLSAGNEILLWSSTSYDTDSNYSPSLYISNDFTRVGGMEMSTWRTYGLAVRCIKDEN
jgi:hypothetical protein